MSAVVDLSNGAMLVSVPDTNDRYYVVNVFDMWHNLQHYIGRRTTGTKAGTFALTPPGWTGTLPSGVTELPSSTSKVWLWGRLRVSPGEAVAPILELQDQFTLKPLNPFAGAAQTFAGAPRHRRR